MQPAYGPSLESLFAILPQPLPVPRYSIVEPKAIPEPFRQLLVHACHMTVAMEYFHQSRIGVRVVQRRSDDGWYARQIVLLPRGTEQVVQGGIVRIHMTMLDPEVQEAIRREDTPLGHVLIRHEVLRHIEVTQYLRIEPGPELACWPGFPQDEPCYARLGILYCDRHPAIELFEIVPTYRFKTEETARQN